MQIKTTIRFFTIADYEKEQEYIFALLFGILICLYLLVCKTIFYKGIMPSERI